LLAAGTYVCYGSQYTVDYAIKTTSAPIVNKATEISVSYMVLSLLFTVAVRVGAGQWAVMLGVVMGR